MKVRKDKTVKSKRKLRKVVKKGLGFVDKLIDKLPVELHLPRYNYCGPGLFHRLILNIQKGGNSKNNMIL